MPKLTYACVLTRDIDRLDDFYRAVLQLEPTSSRSSYIEFGTQPGLFSVWALDDFEPITGTSASMALAAGSVMLEFEVEDVDAEYARLQHLEQLAIEFVLAPKTLPWGNRSIYFRDPDGNLVNFFSRVG
jgi:catechol 2,3-dioxygenase-like lactoylglutathione lyase family enzyme